MTSNKIRGSWNQVKGFSRELWGELTGNDQAFSSGLRQRVIGKLESAHDMPHVQAEQLVDKLLQ